MKTDSGGYSAGRLTRRSFVAASGGAVAAAALSGVAPRRAARAAEDFAGKSIRVLTWTDETGQAALRNIAQPFESMTGAKVLSDLTAATSEMVAKIKASAANQQYDVVILSGVGAIELANQGMLDKPDLALLPNNERIGADFRTGASGFGVGYLLWCDGLLFNTQTMAAPPDSYLRLWDDDRAGRIFLPPPDWIEAMYLTVVAARVAGGDERNPDGGFELLAELRDRVLLLGQNPPQIADLIRAGSIDLGGPYSPMHVPDFLRQPEYNVGATLNLEEGFFYDLQFMVVPKGHPGDTAVIHAFMNYALSADVQAKMAEEVFYGPTNMDTRLSEAARNSP
jgi:putative spermidine/putrescine transport system substrate-binding protein